MPKVTPLFGQSWVYTGSVYTPSLCPCYFLMHSTIKLILNLAHFPILCAFLCEITKCASRYPPQGYICYLRRSDVVKPEISKLKIKFIFMASTYGVETDQKLRVYSPCKYGFWFALLTDLPSWIVLVEISYLNCVRNVWYFKEEVLCGGGL
jgi:hypothetical protein